MSDYSARIIHDDRTAQFRREADASRLASDARHGRPRTTLPARIRSLRLAIVGWVEHRTDRRQPTSSPSVNGYEANRITPAAE